MFEYQDGERFDTKVLNFPEEVYRITDPSSHIYKIMYALLEVGLGQLGTWQDEANNSESMAGTKYTDLDSLFSFLGISRLPSEIYPFNPYHDQLVSAQWSEVTTKDALFRLRIMKFFQSMLRGGTTEGIRMIAEAASGVECQIFEMWRILTGEGIGAGITLGRSPALNLTKEFCIIPLEEIDDDQRAAIIHLVDLIKPVNSICTVLDGEVFPYEEANGPFSAAENYFEVRSMVSASNSLLFQSNDIWISPNAEVEGPTFAGMTTQDTEWSLNESFATVSTFKIDPEFILPLGVLVGGINDSVQSLVVDETTAPAAPAFSIKIATEEIYVTQRTPVSGEATQFTYTILRGRNGSDASAHSNEDPVNIGVIPIYSPQVLFSAQFGSWIDIPIADSPDNYPNGKFTGDPSRYASDGSYLFEYPSQDAFLARFTNEIQDIGGEILGGRYRLPVPIDTPDATVTSPEDSLAPPTFIIEPRIFSEQL